MSSYLEAQRINMILRVIKENSHVIKAEAHDYVPDEETSHTYKKYEIEEMKKKLKEIAPRAYHELYPEELE